MKKLANSMYSIVMSVYSEDHPEWVREAIESLINQSIVSDDIVIVADGPLSKPLNDILEKYVNGKTVSLVRLQKNSGLGAALNVGIEKTKHELVARMDSDDISVPNRFELQLAEFSNNSELDILGGQIAEFINSTDNIVAYRDVPLTQSEINRFSRRRNPFNHPTVMYKKSVITKLGGYDSSAIRIEDYDLWLRALSEDAACANLDIVLVHYRLTPNAIKRRKTFLSLKNHLSAKSRFYRKRYINLADFVYGVTTQVLLFLMPSSVANILFNKLVRR